MVGIDSVEPWKDILQCQFNSISYKTEDRKYNYLSIYFEIKDNRFKSAQKQSKLKIKLHLEMF